MGVKTILRANDIDLYFPCKEAIATTHGVMDSVYIVDNTYVLKLFENSSLQSLKNEIELLELCSHLKVPKIVTKIDSILDKPALVYTKCNGKSIKNPTKHHITLIGNFLKQMHQTTQEKTSSNENIYCKQSLQKLITKSQNKIFQDIFDTINIKLKDDGIIHGDLFLDNALFHDNTLSCVIDFSQACNGDFLFDLAVVAISWCKNDQEIQALLNAYGAVIHIKQFKNYIRYALLFYSVNRYLDNRDYQTLLKRLECL